MSCVNRPSTAVPTPLISLCYVALATSRDAYDEDRRFWHRSGDADDELEFIGAWARLRIASVNAAIDAEVASWDCATAGTCEGSSVPASCGTATVDQIAELCAAAGITAGGICRQGTLQPECVLPAEAGYDRCGCAPGYGWSTTTRHCEVDAVTSDVEVSACLTGSADGSNGGTSVPNEGSTTSIIIVVVIVLVASGIAIAGATGKLRPKKLSDGGSGIYESSTNTVENPTSTTA